MQTIPLHHFPADEQQAFLSSCTRWRKQPDEFLVEAQECDPRDAASTFPRRDVIVVHYPSVKGKRYEAGPGSRWNAAFERDLQAFYYPSNPRQVYLEIAPERGGLVNERGRSELLRPLNEAGDAGNCG